MPHYLALVGQIRVFTFPIQVAVIRPGIGVFFYGIDGLLKDVIDKLIMGKVQITEFDAVYTAQYLPVQGATWQQSAEQEEVYDQRSQVQ